MSSTYNPAYYQKNLAAMRESCRVWYRKNKEHKRRTSFKVRTGISWEQFQTMIDSQAGLCGVCTKPMVPGRDTHLDHDHATGKIRSVLCSSCNLTLGMIKDDPSIARACADYLEGHV